MIDKIEPLFGRKTFHYFPVFIIGICLLAACYYIDQLNQSQHEVNQRQKVINQLGIIRAHLEGNIYNNAKLVQGLVASIATDPNLSQERFASLAKHLFAQQSSLRNIAAAPNLVIRYMYPVEGNEAAIGLNYRQIPAQLDAVLKARDLNKLVIAGPVSLVQGGKGFIARIPVFLDNDNNSKFWGIISAVIDSDKLYQSSGLFEEMDINIAIRGKDGNGVTGEHFFGDIRLYDQNPELLNISLPYGSWKIAAVPKDGWGPNLSVLFWSRLLLFSVCLLILAPVYMLNRIYIRHRENSTRLRGLFELSPVGIALNDYSSGAFLEVNHALLTSTGYSRAEFLQLNYWDITPDQYREQEAIQLRSLEETGRYGPYEKEYIRKDGSRYPVLLNGMTIHDTNGKKRIWSIIEDISERKNADAALAEYQKQLELVISSTAVGIWDWYVKTGKTEFNQRWAEIIGYTLDELQPTSIETWISLAHPDDLENSGELLEAHWRGETDRYICEARMKHKDGHWVWVLDTGSTVEWYADGSPKRMIGTHLDITERKLAEQKLQASQERYQSLVDDIGDTLVIYSLEAESGKLLFVTNGMKTVFGISPEEAIGQCWDELIQWLPLSLEIGYSNINDMIAEKAGYRQYNMEFIHPEGKIRTIHVSSHPVTDKSGKVIAIGGIVEDITQQKLIEQELITARDAAEKANRAKSDFLSSMSHELRTPMNAILGFSQLLELEELDEQQLDYAKEIHKAGDHLLELINDVLDLAKVESGQFDFTMESVDANETIMDCVKLANAVAVNNNIQIIYAENTPLKVKADRIRLKQVLLNLLSNAVKYNRKGGTVEVKMQQRENGRLRILVTDTGPGISENQISELFKPFNRLDAENSGIEGTGIGLTLSRQITDLMGGGIGVNSKVGVGSTFWIELPMDSSQHLKPAHSTAVKPEEIKPKTNHAMRNVLYIEDNPVNLKLVSSILETQKHLQLLTADNASLGLKVAKTSKPDLILLDINLPEMDGYQLINIIKTDPDLAKIPVFAVTSNAMPDEIEKGKNAGFSAYITKPIDIEPFLDTINKSLCA